MFALLLHLNVCFYAYAWVMWWMLWISYTHLDHIHIKTGTLANGKVVKSAIVMHSCCFA